MSARLAVAAALLGLALFLACGLTAATVAIVASRDSALPTSQISAAVRCNGVLMIGSCNAQAQQEQARESEPEGWRGPNFAEVAGSCVVMVVMGGLMLLLAAKIR